MTGRKSLIGVAVLPVLLFGAFAAANASAEQRAYTCTKAAPDLEFSDAHCSNFPGADFGHVFLKEGVDTTTTASNEKTASGTTASTIFKLKGTLAGAPTEVQCTGVHGHGTLANKAEWVNGFITFEYTGCTVTAPAGKGCKVVGGAFLSNELWYTTLFQEANDLRVEPAVGTQLATIPISGCANNKPPTNNYPVTGKFAADISTATITTTNTGIMAQDEVKWGGVKAGIDSAVTLSMAEGTTPKLTAGEAITFT